MISERPVSPKAQEIADQKGKAWEYALTSSLLRDWIGPIERRYKDLQAGLYAPTKKIIPDDSFLEWAGARMATIAAQGDALNRLVNVELGPTWGPPGQPGSVDEIKRVCSYIADACSRILEWEEEVYSARASEPFSEMIDVIRGISGPHISEIMKMPKYIDEMLSSDAKGNHHFTITISLPPGFDEKKDVALRHIREHLGIDEDD